MSNTGFVCVHKNKQNTLPKRNWNWCRQWKFILHLHCNPLFSTCSTCLKNNRTSTFYDFWTCLNAVSSYAKYVVYKVCLFHLHCGIQIYLIPNMCARFISWKRLEHECVLCTMYRVCIMVSLSTLFIHSVRNVIMPSVGVFYWSFFL